MTARRRLPITRVLAIVAAYGAAMYQGSRDNWLEVAGLTGLGTGLVLLLIARRQDRPPHALRWIAVACFAVTLAAVIHVARRDY